MSGTIVPFTRAVRQIGLTLVVSELRGRFVILAVPPTDPEANSVISRHETAACALAEAEQLCLEMPCIYRRVIDNTGVCRRTSSEVMADVIDGGCPPDRAA